MEVSGLPPSTTAVVSLAGQNILDPKRRWTAGFKQNVWNSRVNTTRSLAKAIIDAPQKPKVFVSISGVGMQVLIFKFYFIKLMLTMLHLYPLCMSSVLGIYPTSSSDEYTEDSPVKATDFLSELAIAWEKAASLPSEAGVRQVIIRSGLCFVSTNLLCLLFALSTFFLHVCILIC